MSLVFIHKIKSTHPHFTAVFALREKVLRLPLGLSLYHEDTSGDAEDDILIALENGVVVGCVMCKPLPNQTMKIRQMAVDDHYQGQNIGRKLMVAAEENAVAQGFKILSLHARKNVVPFYEKLGYTAHGDEFTEVNIPHIAMAKQL